MDAGASKELDGENGMKILESAVRGECARLVRSIIKKGPCAMINQLLPSGSSVLHVASSQTTTETLSCLLGHMIMPQQAEHARNNIGDTALHVASSLGLIESARLLLAHGFDCDTANNKV